MFIGGISLAQAGETPLKEEKKDAKKADKKGAAPKAPQGRRMRTSDISSEWRTRTSMVTVVL